MGPAINMMIILCLSCVSFILCHGWSTLGYVRSVYSYCVAYNSICSVSHWQWCVCVPLQGYGGHTGLGGLPSSLSASTSNLSTASSGTSSSQQGGRRPIIIRDAQQRAMLQNIRDSLAHLQKPNSLPSPGSDHSGMCRLIQKNAASHTGNMWGYVSFYSTSTT